MEICLPPPLFLPGGQTMFCLQECQGGLSFGVQWRNYRGARAPPYWSSGPRCHCHIGYRDCGIEKAFSKPLLVPPEILCGPAPTWWGKEMERPQGSKVRSVFRVVLYENLEELLKRCDALGYFERFSINYSRILWNSLLLSLKHLVVFVHFVFFCWGGANLMAPSLLFTLLW